MFNPKIVKKAGAFAVSEHMANLRWRLRDEVCRVAAALGIDITELSEMSR